MWTTEGNIEGVLDTERGAHENSNHRHSTVTNRNSDRENKNNTTGSKNGASGIRNGANGSKNGASGSRNGKNGSKNFSKATIRTSKPTVEPVKNYTNFFNLYDKKIQDMEDVTFLQHYENTCEQEQHKHRNTRLPLCPCIPPGLGMYILLKV